MSGFEHVCLEEGNSSGDSRDSSLAVSPLSTHRTNCESLASTGADSTKPAMSALFAKVDVSDLLAPLEARLFERLDSVEAMLERRCGALECRVGVLTAAAAATSDTTGFQQQLKVLQAQMEATMGSLQSYMEKESAKISNLTEGLKASAEKQASLSSNIDEVWRQLKADRLEVLTNYQNLSDTIEPRLRGILDKVDRRCTDLGGLLVDDMAPKPAGRPSMSPTPAPRPILAEDAVLGGRSSLSLQAASPTGASSAGPLLSMPASPQVQHRSPLQPGSPGVQPSPGGASLGAPEDARVNRHSSAPMLPVRMRSVEVPAGAGTPSSLGARAAQPVQRAPIQRMASANRAHMSPELSRGGGLLRPQNGTSSGATSAKSVKELPRP